MDTNGHTLQIQSLLELHLTLTKQQSMAVAVFTRFEIPEVKAKAWSIRLPTTRNCPRGHSPPPRTFSNTCSTFLKCRRHAWFWTVDTRFPSFELRRMLVRVRQQRFRKRFSFPFCFRHFCKNDLCASQDENVAILTWNNHQTTKKGSN